MKTTQISLLAAALALTCALASAQDKKKAAAPPSKAPAATEKAAPASGQPPMSKDQKAMMDAMQRMGEVRAEHKQLDYFVGDWSATTTMLMDPKAPQKTEGKTHTESLYGGRYVEMHYQGTYEGQPFSGEGFFGYDNLKGKFFNTWIDSMSTGFWLAWGTYNESGKTYTFQGQMDDPMKAGAKFPVREVVHIVDPTHYSFEWYETHAGKEAKMMQIDYTKK